MIYKIEALISDLKIRSEICHLEIYAPDADKDWFYYYTIDGYLHGRYFSLSFMHSTVPNAGQRSRIAECTDCKHGIGEILELHGL